MAPVEMTPDELADELARCQEECFGWALNCCGWDEPLAEDVLQTAYVRVISGRARFEGRAAFRTWLFGVIRRVSQEHGRRRRSRSEKLVELGHEAEAQRSVEADPIGDLARAESSRQLLRTLAQLSERQREVLHLVFYQDMTIAEAAGVMGVSLGSARTHYERGKKRMRVLLEEKAVHE